MEIIEVKTNKLKKQYIKFIYDLYKDDENFCDMNILFVKNFLYQKDSYAKRCTVRPIILLDNGEIKLECIYVIDKTNDIKLSFIEFKKNATKYLKRIIEYSKELLKEYSKKKVIVGINGQISYGLGILTDKYNRKFEFNSNYNLPYYTKEMDKIFPITKKAFSYNYKATNSLSLFDNNLLDSIYNKFEFRYLDMRHFKKDMLIFGDLCHKSLKNTPYYSEKTPYEMYELMRQLKFIMKKEDIIFVLKDGKEIGFVYTHPDYAELFNKPRLNYITFYFKYLFKKTHNVIYNIIGVLPEYQKTGLAVALIHKSIMMRQKDYPYGSSSFILEDNIPSTMLCKKLSISINKEFHLYEIQGDDNV